MKPSERKQEFVRELASFYEKLDVNRLYGFPNQKDSQGWIADVGSVLKNLDESDYQEFIRLSKTVGLSENREERKKAAKEINQFLGRKVAEWKRYDFSSLDQESNRNASIGLWNKGKGNTFKSTSFSGTDVGMLDEGKNTRMSDTYFLGKRHSSRPIFGNVTVSGGTVVFGDGAKITQVAVKELVEALSDEIKEKVPDSEQKNSVLKTLKDITTNETFATVAGTFVGEILRRVSRP